MDIFDARHICNHTDEEGRYSYNVSFTLMYRFSALFDLWVSHQRQPEMVYVTGSIFLILLTPQPPSHTFLGFML